VPPLKPDPQYFLKAGMGNGGNTKNRIVLCTNDKSTAPTAFEGYGYNAKPMAKIFEDATKKDIQFHPELRLKS